MDVRNVSGLRSLKFAVVDKQNNAVSLHQHPDAAETARKAYRLGEEFEVIELKDPISYLQR